MALAPLARAGPLSHVGRTETDPHPVFRFLHSSDLHLGKRFGRFPEETRGRLREARHAAIGRLAAAAREGGAGTILLAGDTFDTETPSPATLRQALAAMASHAPLSWVILPGNHDPLQAEELWGRLRAARPDNVIFAETAAPMPLAAGAILLPAPCTARRPGRDLTEWMDRAATPDGTLRIGLAHGAVHDFSEDGRGADIVAPDRAARARLDYLALGDWHGEVAIGPRCRYSGTPEPDRFKHEAPGRALLVALDGPGAEPDVRAVPTGSFAWRTLALDLLSGTDTATALAALLPTAGRRETLLRVAASGRTRPEGRVALERAFGAAAPEFAHAELDAESLATECEVADLDAIDAAGALRGAAEALLAESRDDRLPGDARAIAEAALVRLFGLSSERPA